MADNVISDPGTGGATFATDDIGGVHYPIQKITIGALDSQTLLTGGNGATDAGTVRVTVSTDSTGVLSVDDNGGSLTVDATALDIRALTNADVITAELSATDNAVLDSIDSNTGSLAVVGGGTEATAVRVTIANDSTGVLTVDASALDIRALTNADVVTAELSATDNAVLDSIDTNTTGLNNTVGTDGAAGPASTLSIGGTESGGNIQELRVDTDGHLQVDVLSGGGGGSPGVVDTNNSTTSNLGNGGVFTGTATDVLAYSAVTINLYSDQDSATEGMEFQFCSNNSFGADTDISAFTMTAGEARRFQFPRTAQYFRIVYTNGTSTTTDLDIQTILCPESPAYSSIHKVEDNVSIDRSAELVKSALIAQVNGTGDFIPIQANAGGVLKTTGGGAGSLVEDDDDAIVAGQTVDVVIGMNYLYDGTDWSRAAAGTGVRTGQTQRVTIATDDVVPASQSGTWNITNVSGTVSLPTGAATEATLGTIDTDTGNIAAGYAVEGSALGSGVLIQGDDGTDRTNVLVDTAGHLQVDIISGPASFAVQEDGLALTALEKIDNAFIAHSDAITGSHWVNLTGLEARSSEPAAVSNGDATRAIATLLGKAVTVPYAVPGDTWSYAGVSGGITDTADDVAKAAAGASIRNYITKVSVVNGHATVGTEVVIKDGSTVIWRSHAEAAGGGVAEEFKPPLRGTANTAVNVTNITTGSKTYFNLQGFIAAE